MYLRFESNAHESDPCGHVVTGTTPGGCVSIYPYTALMNHSCDPNSTIEPAKLGGDRARLHTRCNRRVHEGDELTYNYGPTELVTKMSLA